MAQSVGLIEKLVTELHLNVTERAELGLKGVRYAEVAAAISRILGDVGWFPPHASPWHEGSPVFEGTILKRLADGKIRLTLQRGRADAPRALAERVEVEFRTVDEAIREYVKAEWPKGIDGIAIE